MVIFAERHASTVYIFSRKKIRFRHFSGLSPNLRLSRIKEFFFSQNLTSILNQMFSMYGHQCDLLFFLYIFL